MHVGQQLVGVPAAAAKNIRGVRSFVDTVQTFESLKKGRAMHKGQQRVGLPPAVMSRQKYCSFCKAQVRQPHVYVLSLFRKMHL
jgi:hypothetical protein